ncbi:MAG: hypothetical protein IKP95_09365 [Ruminococcus sp.]|nr:hypothetical protein [Ruminococcus sp.]
MSYIDYAYYTDVYGGKNVPPDEFDRLSEIASMAVDAAVYCDIDVEADYMDDVKRATAYEVDTVYAYGGESVAYGESSANIVSEGLDDYSYHLSSAPSAASGGVVFCNGIPISPIVLSLLSKAGLRNRWVHAYDGDDADV